MQIFWFSLKRHSTGFWLWHLVLPLFMGLVLWKIYPETGIDQVIESWYYDSSLQAFPLRNEPWLTVGMHSGLKLFGIGIGLCVFGAWVFSFIEPTFLQPERRCLAWIWISIALASGLISMLKHGSIHHCPWDIAEYGGYAPYLPLFGSLPAGMQPGKCFPAGHASGGFALLAIYFGFLDSNRRVAFFALTGAIFLGFVMGWAQTMRGAHFLSHTLWSAWIVWQTNITLYLLIPPVLHISKPMKSSLPVAQKLNRNKSW